MKNTLSKNEKLKSKKLIEQLFKEGKGIYSFPLHLIYVSIDPETTDYSIQFGVTVSKRKFKKAVDRNLLKRKMREAYRLNKQDFFVPLLEADKTYAFMLMYMSKKKEDYHTIEEGLLNIQKKFLKKLEL